MTSDPTNSAQPATALTFEEWLKPQLGNGAHYPGSSASGYAEQGWNARQPEIDALRERERWLREYVAHKPDCHTEIGCSRCTCGLLELLAAKEGL